MTSPSSADTEARRGVHALPVAERPRIRTRRASAQGGIVRRTLRRYHRGLRPSLHANRLRELCSRASPQVFTRTPHPPRALHPMALEKGTGRAPGVGVHAPLQVGSIHSPTYRSVNPILASGTDRQPLRTQPTQTSLPLHENVRGPDDYH